MFGAVGSGWSSPSSSLERSDGFEQRRNSNAARNRPPPLQSDELTGSTLDPSFGAKEPVPAIPVAGRRSPLALASRRYAHIGSWNKWVRSPCADVGL